MTPGHSPQPLRGLFTSIGHALRFVLGGFLSWLYHHVLVRIGHGFHVAFGSAWPYVAGGVALALGVAAALLVWRRRSRVAIERQRTGGRRTPSEDPAELERQAEAAAAAGDYESTVRWWFRAGIIRLTQIGAVDNGPTRTDGQLRHAVRSATFSELAQGHERIVYGRQRATVEDATAARDGWPRVVRDARESMSVHGAPFEVPS